MAFLVTLHVTGIFSSEFEYGNWSLQSSSKQWFLTEGEEILERYDSVEGASQDSSSNASVWPSPRCAINFYGLPRAFKEIVLPSIVRNIIEPNLDANCDYFVHYYNVSFEESGRSGSGGSIRTGDIFLLRDAVDKAVKYRQRLEPGANRIRKAPVVHFVSSTNENFHQKFDGLLNKVTQTMDPNQPDKPLYLPWRDFTASGNRSVINLLKMWNSIQIAWETMEDYATLNTFQYEYVAMFRSDVMYLTPIELVPSHRSKDIVLAGFARYPVNDRMVMGPASKVKIWATERFDRLDDHVQWMAKNKDGLGMHSEQFIHKTLLPAMTNSSRGVPTFPGVVVDPTICFCRARSDGTIWIDDCNKGKEVAWRYLPGRDLQLWRRKVEQLLGRECPDPIKMKEMPYPMVLNCSK